MFDALTSRRPYKEPWSAEAAFDFLKENAGKQFDPDIVQAFEPLLPQMAAIRVKHPDPHSATRH